MFIVFEGIDGSGKTTIIEKLKKFLPEYFKNKQFVFTREPGGTNLKEAEQIRAILLEKQNDIDSFSEAILFMAARRMHLNKVIWPALEQNKIVICDRFVDSSIAYQGAGKNIGVEKIAKLNDLIVESTYPDYTFYLQTSVHLSKERLNKNRVAEDRIENNNDDFFEKIVKCYDELFLKNKDRYILINSNNSIDVVYAEVKKEIVKIIEKAN
ncbi:dTMP kinase [Mesomycoplasma neurolyticum]|uniref:Thymidylate kinase n=1 Tax=Mesomycoplasma neurolyticum TaxID=2120 RepID=A0A449A560_9BACT|nr:dTMP kinase [Mesomycoplasma neurolyticum]VEU59378.1 Thymidylate kinase [Mesomycoplasma neurolyticum]